VAALSSIGYSLGSEWSKVNHGLTQISYVVVAVVVVAIIGFVILRLREFRKESAAAAREEVPAARAGSGRPDQANRTNRPGW